VNKGNINHSKSSETYIVKFLNEELSRRKRINSSYSMRSFAKFLEMDNSTLSKVLSSKRPVGIKLARKILKKFNLDDQKIDLLIKSKVEEDEYIQLGSEKYSLISDWYYYAILELIRLDEFIANTKWISQRLHLELSTTQEAIDKLIQYNFISIDDSGKWIDLTGGKTTHLTEGSTNIAKKNHQKDILKLGMDAIDTIPLEKRSHTSMTFAIDTEKLNDAKNIISKFRKEMGKLLSRGEKRNEVYHLGIQLYPITHNIQGEEK